jgi:Cys-tRNA synthase (O-phospho-L-seryl-tRNA:Cys-tRNA synthase)
MALPADVQQQIAQRETRLRLVPAGETPPSTAVREQVQRWQEQVHEAAETIRWADATTEQLAGISEMPERDRVQTPVRGVRAHAFDLMRQLNPEQAWFWTQEWQAEERGRS